MKVAIAVCVVLVVGLSCMCGVGVTTALLVMRKQEPPPRTFLFPFQPSDLTPEKPKDVSDIVAHKWWTTPPSEKWVDDLIDKILGCNDGSKVFFDRSFNVVVKLKGSEYTSEDNMDAIPTRGGLDADVYYYPKGIASKHIRFPVYGDKRPTRQQVINSILRDLDSAEFKHGPGK